jgi:hypothetical protein
LVDLRKATRVARALERQYLITDDFYPGCSLHLQIAGGLTGDVVRNLEILHRLGASLRVVDVFSLMQAKRLLVRRYSTKRTKSVEQFGNILLKVKPIGGVSPLDYELANIILTALVVYGVSKFTGSFLSEAGKIAAQKLFNKKPQQVASELSIHIDLVDLVKSEVKALCQDERFSSELALALKRREKRKR